MLPSLSDSDEFAHRIGPGDALQGRLRIPVSPFFKHRLITLPSPCRADVLQFRQIGPRSTILKKRSRRKAAIGRKAEQIIELFLNVGPYLKVGRAARH